MSEKFLLIDGNSILYRAFYGAHNLSNSKGVPTNGVFAFLNMMFKAIEDEQPKYMVVTFDLKAPTFRHKMYAEYKAGRSATPDDLKIQIPLLKEVLKSMNIAIFEKEGFEADDLIGTLSKQGEENNLSNIVFSGDKDLLQLASDVTKIRLPKTVAGSSIIKHYFKQDLIDELGVTPDEFIEVKALMGDKSDNIIGVPGIGEKTALKLIKEYKSVENTIANVENIKGKVGLNIKENVELARISKVLVTIIRDAPVTLSLEDTLCNNIYNQNSYKLICELEFKSLAKKFLSNMPENMPETSSNDKSFTPLDDNLDCPWDLEENPSDTTQIEQIKIEIQHITNEVEAIDFFKNLPKTETAYLILTNDVEFIGLAIHQKGAKHTFIEANELFDFGAFKILNIAKDFFENPEYIKIGCDIKKDIKFFRDTLNIDLDETNFSKGFDVMIGAYLINPTAKSYDYEKIAEDFLGLDNLSSWEDILGKGRKKLSFFTLENAVKCDFICKQIDIIYNAKNSIIAKMEEKEQTSLYCDIEYPLIFVLANMEKEGIQVDKSALLDFQKLITEKENELANEINELAGEEFNANSPKQLGVILFEKLGLSGGKKTKSGNYSTAVDTLENLQGSHPIIEKILEYRHVSKLKGTYADGLIAVLDSKTNKIHSTFNQAITATGRISSTEPNLQNIPTRMELGREVRKVFVPKSEDYCFLDADYSQIELRILACISEDEVLIKAFNDNQDIHALTASQVFHVPLEQVTSLQRRNAKAVNFGIIYGIGAFSLAGDLGISRKEANEYIQAYFVQYPKIKAYLENTVESAKECGYAETIFKRRREILELKSSHFATKSFGERIAMNMPIQGSAADIIKIAMIKVYKALKDGGYKSKLILQVHDELLIETHKDEEAEVSKILQENMEQAVNLAVLLQVDLHSGNSWYELK